VRPFHSYLATGPEDLGDNLMRAVLAQPHDGLQVSRCEELIAELLQGVDALALGVHRHVDGDRLDLLGLEGEVVAHHALFVVGHLLVLGGQVNGGVQITVHALEQARGLDGLLGLDLLFLHLIQAVEQIFHRIRLHHDILGHGLEAPVGQVLVEGVDLVLGPEGPVHGRLHFRAVALDRDHGDLGPFGPGDPRDAVDEDEGDEGDEDEAEQLAGEGQVLADLRVVHLFLHRTVGLLL